MSRDRYGPRAARSYGTLIDPLLLRLRARIAQICTSLEATTMLDIACATGAQCRALGRAGLRTTGLDLSEAMIQAASGKGGRNVHYAQGSAYDLPFKDGSFDAAVLSLALHEHSEDERQVMVREALRVIRPSGHLILADYTKPRWAPVHLPWQLIRLVEWIAGPEHYAGFRDYVHRGSLRGLLHRLKLEPVSLQASHFGAIEIATCQLRKQA